MGRWSGKARVGGAEPAGLRGERSDASMGPGYRVGAGGVAEDHINSNTHQWPKRGLSEEEVNSPYSVLSPAEVQKIRKRWNQDPSFMGYPDAERDSQDDLWASNLLTQPHWFLPATRAATTIIVGRKGVGKSAARIAADMRSERDDVLTVSVSADELASWHGARLRTAAERGFGAVADWGSMYAELVVRNAAAQMTGRLITGDDEVQVRKWAVQEGITERDWGERVAGSLKSLRPWAEKILAENPVAGNKDTLFRRVMNANSFALYIDDFDNIQEKASIDNLRLIRDAVEAADRITHHRQAQRSSVHLLMRQDLWLRLCPGWHYSDKVTGLAHLNWTQDDLRKWLERRLFLAACRALGVAPEQMKPPQFEDLWAIFFPPNIHLQNDKESTGIHYVVRRTMYTPRSLRKFLELIMKRSPRLPADQRAVEDAEEDFSREQLEFLKTEFASLCDGLDICLESFTNRTSEVAATALYRHLKGLIGNGQVRLHAGASDGVDEIALARFLFRIGFLETRYYDTGERYEVRDAMRYPEHWSSIRKDDAVRWAVRSAFFCALRSHR